MEITAAQAGLAGEGERGDWEEYPRDASDGSSLRSLLFKKDLRLFWICWVKGFHLISYMQNIDE
jgi:hypothetical protein